jgi:hypothetical protein
MPKGMQRSLGGHSDPYDAGTPEVWERADVGSFAGDPRVRRRHRLECAAQPHDEGFVLLAEELERHVQRSRRHPANRGRCRSERLRVGEDGVA